MNVAVDFDGTLHPYTAGWIGETPADEPPTEGALEFCQALTQRGHRLIVFSARAETQAGHEGIWGWLQEHRLAPYISQVTHEKPFAVAYVDDRAVPYTGSWKEALAGVDYLMSQAGKRG